MTTTLLLVFFSKVKVKTEEPCRTRCPVSSILGIFVPCMQRAPLVDLLALWGKSAYVSPFTTDALGKI